MKKFVELLRNNEEWLMKRILKYAIDRGYSQYTSTLEEAWRVSIVGLSESMILLVQIDEKAPEFSPEEEYKNDPVTKFAIDQAIKHRQRGTTLEMFLGLLKYYRQCYFDLIDEIENDLDSDWAKKFIQRAFDRFEMGFCSEWSKTKEDEKLYELQVRNRSITNEKNAYLTAFESITDPVILLNHDYQIINLNFAAAQLLNKDLKPGGKYYNEELSRFKNLNKYNKEVDKIKKDIKSRNLFEIFEWLSTIQDEISDEIFEKKTFSISTKLDDKIYHFEVVFSKMLGVNEKHTQYILTLRDVTEHKEYIQTLSQKSSLVEVLQDGIVVIDLQGKVKEWNLSCERIFGYTYDEVIGKDLDLISNNDKLKKLNKEIIASVIESGSWHGEINFKRKDGEIIYLESTILTLKNETNEIESILGIHRDVSELKKSEHELYSIIENTDSNIWLINSKYELIKLNSSMKQGFINEFGIVLEEGINIIERLAKEMPEVSAEWKSRYDRALLGETFSIIDEFNFNDKRIFTKSKFTPIKETEKLTGVSVFSEIITDQKIAEEALKESEEQYRSLFETMAQGVVYHNTDGKILKVNHAAERILGVSSDRLIGRTTMDTRWKTINEDGSLFGGEKHPAMQALESGQKVSNVVLGVYNPEQETYKWINVSAVPQFHETENTPYQVYTTFEDITNIKKAEKALKDNEQKYRTLFENMNEGFALHKIVTDSNNKPVGYKFIDINPAFESLTTLKKDNIIGEDITQIFPGIENDPVNWIGRYSKVALTGEIAQFEDFSEDLGRWFNINAFSPSYGYFATIISDISKRKAAEQQITDVSELNQTILDSSTLGIIVYDFDGQCVMANEAASKIIGSESEEVLMQNFRKTESWKKFGLLPLALTALKSEKPQSFETELTLTFGKHFWIKCMFNSFYRQGRQHLLLTAEDITEAKESEKELFESQQRLQLALDASQVGVWYWNLIENILDWDDRMCEIFGLDVDTIRDYEGFTKCLHKDDIDRVSKEVAESIANKTEFVSDYRIVWKDGTIKNILAQGKVLYLDDGSPDKMFGVCIDITERKEAEMALRDSEERLSLALDSAKAGKFDHDFKTQYLRWDERSCEIFGINPENFNNSYEDWSKKVHPDDLERSEKEFQRVLNTKEENYLEIEYRIILPDNEINYVLATGYIAKDENYKPLKIFGLHLDITEQKRHEQELKTYAKAQETLLREVNHRVKNNLAALLSILHKEEEKAMVLGIKNVSPIIKDLTNRVTGLSTVHTLLSSSGWRPLEIDQLCKKVIGETLKSIKQTRKVLLTTTPSDIKVNSTQAHHLTLVLNELATNSIKHSENTVLGLKIDVTIEKNNESIKIVYRDNGPGYPKEILGGDYSYSNIGFQLINGIITQSLEGSLEFTNDNGAVTTIYFEGEEEE